MAESKHRYKYSTVIVAGLLLCLASVGIAYAFQGTYTDTANSENIGAHWVEVGSAAKISVAASDLAVDVDTQSTLDGTAYSLSSTQSHGTYDAEKDTVTFSHIKIGTLIFKGSDSSITGGTLSLSLSGNDADGVEVSLNGTYDHFTVDEPMDVYADVVVSASAVEGTSEPVIKTPAFTLTAMANVTE